MQAQIQQDTFDAWQKGGEGPDGKPVTDEKLLAYIKSRRNDLSKDDPSWAEWDNALTQYTFSIGESKQQLAYKQGKISAGGMASWYKGQLNSIHKDTEWYRTVAGYAADWGKQALAQAKAEAKKRASLVMQDKYDKAQKPINDYADITTALTNWAKNNGWLTGNNTIEEMANANIPAFEAALSAGGPLGADGKPITVQSWRDAGRKALKGQDTTIAVLTQAGMSTTDARKKRQDLLSANSRLGSFDERAQYENIRTAHEHDLAAAQNDPRRIKELNLQYAAQLDGLRTTALNDPDGQDHEFIGGLSSEILVVTTGKVSGGTAADKFGNSLDPETTSTSDAEETAQSFQNNEEKAQALADGTGYYGQEKPGGPLDVIPIERDPVTGGNNVANSQNAILNINGVATQVLLKGDPIQAYGVVDKKGNLVTNQTPEQIAAGIANGTLKVQPKIGGGGEANVIGYTYTSPNADGGAPQQHWGVRDPTTGAISVTDINPFEGAQRVTGSAGAGFVVGENGHIIGGNFADGKQINPATGQPFPVNTPIDPMTGMDSSQIAIIDPTLDDGALNSMAQKFESVGLTVAGAQLRGIVGKRGLLRRVGEANQPISQPQLGRVESVAAGFQNEQPGVTGGATPAPASTAAFGNDGRHGLFDFHNDTTPQPGVTLTGAAGPLVRNADGSFSPAPGQPGAITPPAAKAPTGPRIPGGPIVHPSPPLPNAIPPNKTPPGGQPGLKIPTLGGSPDRQEQSLAVPPIHRNV